MSATPSLTVKGWLSRNYDDDIVGEAERKGMFSFCVPRRGKFMWREYYLQNTTKPRAPYRHIRLLFHHIHSLLSEVLCVLNYLVLFTCSNKTTACSKQFSLFTKRVYFVHSKVSHKTGCPSCFFFFFTYALTTDYIITWRWLARFVCEGLTCLQNAN